MEYKDTLNLPKTKFSMRANLAKEEPKMLRFWEEQEIYKKIFEKRKGLKKYILHDGPPYANGNIHIGTAYNKILKDIIPKYKSMKGFNAHYVPGWDTHGLPIEYQVTKNLKVALSDIDPVKLRKKCKEYAKHYIDVQREEFKRLGVMGEWDNPYLTFNPAYEAKQIEIFGKMFSKGYIYKGLKPVYWCAHCETALAAAEIEYNDKESSSIYVRFLVKDNLEEIFPESKSGQNYIVIWTTTPWTIPGNMAIALNTDIEYSLVKTEKGNLILASALVEKVMKKIRIDDYKGIGTKKGKFLEGIKCKHPIFERDSVIILGNHVLLDEGTGCVHTAPGHGQEDYEIAMKYKLPIFTTLDSRGRFNEEGGKFKGLTYKEGNFAVIEELTKNGTLLKVGKIMHSYPHCWRCRKPVVFRATKQWFVSIKDFRDLALKEIEKVQFIPAWGKEKIYGMVENRTDWCISRQRVWGVPLPVFYCKKCGEIIVNDETIKLVKELFLEKGSDSWFTMSAKEILPKDYQCPYCQGKDFEKEKDIMDVWFDSGCSHAAVLKKREELHWPAELYLEGTDQHRGWFQTSLLTSVAVFEKAPYKTVLTHGFIVDTEGKKMSRSVGNVIAPQEIIEKYGADILRLWIASSDYRTDIRISSKILDQLVEIYRRVRNTARFILGNLSDFNPDTDAVPYDKLNELERLVLSNFQSLVKRVNESYDKFEFHSLYHEIHNFCAIDLSSFYLDIIKDRLYTAFSDSEERRAAQTVLYRILDDLVKLIAPVLSFTAEEIWQHLKAIKEDEASIFLTSWPKINEEYIDEDLEQKWDKILKIRKDVLKALELKRQEGFIGNSLEAQVNIYTEDKEIYDYLKSFKGQLETIFIVSKVELVFREKDMPSDIYSGEEISAVKVLITKAPGKKCERCWCYSETVGGDQKYTTICEKCAKVMHEHFEE
ncbi:isoleucine--tRNA ligase [Candidatus Atribacteria bacterium HGW-Atribacteria-1]|nr:MAG: isoleucine--tRNA ligase [Candidatus Atribacteria bacterium HGW-Atribacteria-1]